MSGSLVSAVLESALAPDLKFTAAVLASFGDDNGFRIWPAVGEVAYLRGLKERQVQVHMKELRDMEILAIAKPATQWFPVQYRMVREKLPWRPPYKAPERQPFLLRGGESPPDHESGVQSTAPLPGVQSSASGVQPTAPDPSLDPSLRTHTYRARASADASDGDTTGGESPRAGVQPAAPLETGDRLPLIVAPARDPDHAACAWCGRVCVPRFLHKQFKRALGGPITKRAARMRAFYTETLEAIPSAQPIGEEPLKFWRAAFAARFGGAAPRLVPSVRSAALDHSNADAWDRYHAQREKEQTGS